MTATLGLEANQSLTGAEHTIREIGQQPDIWQSVAEIVSRHRRQLEEFMKPLVAQSDLRIILTGAGTSAFVGEILAPALSKLLGRRVEAIATTDLVSNPGDYLVENDPTLLVSFARSGNSPESVAAASLADQFLSDCYQLVITCDSQGRLYQEYNGRSRSFALLMPKEANDQSFAMTSSFSSMLLAAWLIFVGDKSARFLEPLCAAGRVMLSRDADLARLASHDLERVVFLGSGSLKGLARESALKLLELTAGGITTFFDSSLGFRHGPKSVLNDRTLVVVYLSADEHARRYDLDLVNELRQTVPDDHLLVLTCEEGHDDDALFWRIPELRGENDVLLALPFVVTAQLLGLHLSLKLGRRPDNPFPDKQVNRVVEGVRIYPVDRR